MSRYPSYDYYGFAPYVPVAQRRANAAKETAKLAKAGKVITPVQIAGRKIATSFWGKAWCDNLEAYSDYENRLPRGRTYVRNGSVVHLEIRKGEVEALVSGSELYKIAITITPVPNSKWKELCKACAGGIGSLVELLQGKLSDRVMEIITRRDGGLFPSPKEIKLKCSCPDSARLCKHLAAVIYGIGNRLDQQPELLFLLRSVDSAELISRAAEGGSLTTGANAGPGLADDEIGAIFGIELDHAPASSNPVVKAAKKAAKKVAKKVVKGKPITRKTAKAKPTAPTASKPPAKKATRKQPAVSNTTAKKAAAKKARPIKTATSRK
jgi:uncharacterized Zn finger protein